MQCARINDVTGIVVLCRGRKITLYTLNGDLILEQSVRVEADDAFLSCAFYEGSGDEYLERDLIFTGHKRGVVNVSDPQDLAILSSTCLSLSRYGVSRYETAFLSWSM